MLYGSKSFLLEAIRTSPLQDSVKTRVGAKLRQEVVSIFLGAEHNSRRSGAALDFTEGEAEGIQKQGQRVDWN